MSDFQSIIYSRRSIRKFKPDAVEKEKVDRLLKAALLAPSGKRMYPCEFIVVNDKSKLKAIAQAKSHGAKLIEGAPMAIVVAVNTDIYDVWVEDATIASTFIMLEAENLGLGCCWVQMHLRGTEDGKTAADNLRNTLNLPENFDVLSVLAIGYKAEEKPAYTKNDFKAEKLHVNGIGNKYSLD